MKYILTVLYLTFTSLGVYLMKIGGDSLKITFGHSFSLKIGMITFFGFLCYAISFLIYQKLLIQFDLSSFVPIVTAIVQIIVFLIGIFLLKEKINIVNIFGIIFLIVGFLLLAYKK